MINISREAEVNLINILIDQDVISGKDLISIKKISTDENKTQLEAVFQLELTDEDKILDLLVKEQSLEIIDLTTIQITDELKTVLPSNYINMNFIAPFKIDGNILHIAIPDSSKLSLMRNLKTITKKDIELHGNNISFLKLCDALTLSMPIGLGLVRIGNFLNGELYGRETDGSWGFIFPTDYLGLARHPSQLYEAFGEGLILFFLLSFF